MQVRELRRAIEELHGILSAAKAKGQSKEVAAFLKLFDGADDQDVDQFLLALAAQLQERSTSNKPLARQPHQGVVQHYVKLLRACGTDRSGFDAEFAKLCRDTAVEKSEAEAIAFEYIGYAEGRKTWPHRKAALDAIEDWFRQVAYDAVKSIQLDKARYVG